MSHLVKKLTVIAIAMFVLLSMSAFAQNTVNPKLIASAGKDSKPAKAAAAPQHSATPSQNWMTHRFEISFQGGGVVGGNLGEPDLGVCAPSITAGCDVNGNINKDQGTGGIYPSLVGGLRYFQAQGGVQPGNGGLWGVRVGWNLTPRWQLEFIYNHAHTRTAFTNEDALNTSIDDFKLNGFASGNAREISYDQGFDGRPQGDQNMWLFNLNRNFNAGGRIVPYIGGGIGAESWYGGPKLNLFSTTGQRTGNPSGAQFTKFSGNGTGFAFDFAAGAKMYLTPRFGVRADFMDVISFPELTHTAQSIDITGFATAPGGLVPISGTTKQSGRFNQALFTGGVFWAFGGGWANEHANMGSFASDNFWDHWELSFNFGGVHGRRNGSSEVKCTGAVTNGCLLGQDLSIGSQVTNPISVYPNKIQGPLSLLLARGGLKPGDGWSTGLRLAYNFTPNWDVSFIWNVAGTGTTLDNQALVDQSINSFTGTEVAGGNTRLLDTLNGADGRPRGNQSMYLFNVDRNFHVTRRFVPYLGVGLGWEAWNNDPAIHFRTDVPDSTFPNVADYTKRTRNQMSFALDIAGGAKYYLTRHFGVRTDIMDVLSFNNFRTDFATIDTSGLYGTPGALVPVSGRLSQDSHFSQLIASGGVFWSFGQGGTWESHSATDAGTGAHAGRWELSFQTGGIVGGNLGRPNFGHCVQNVSPGAADGCDVNGGLSVNEGIGVYPGKFGGLRDLQAFGGVEPGNGGLYGVRLGYNLTPQWQIEFIFNHAQTKTAFTNQDIITDTTNAYSAQHFEGNSFRSFEFLEGFDGKPQGNQNQWLVNLDRSFNVAGRFVPYIGAGAGGVSWYGNPKLNLFTYNPDRRSSAEFLKTSGSANGFAFDLATGAKIYVTNNFGFRADFTDVMSFPEFRHTFQSIDLGNETGLGAGSLVPISGSSKQSGHFNQAMFTAGVFWSLGGRMDTKAYHAPTGDRESLNDHWELSFNFGGVHGSTWGSAGTTCTEGVALGCAKNENLAGHNDANGISVFPGKLQTSLPDFMATGGVKPGDGWMTGFQIGYNLSQNWQVAFIYNYLGTGTRFDNEHLLHLTQAGFYAGCDCEPPNRTFNYLNSADGSPRGNQHQLLVNLNRNFRVSSRIVPYIGAGLGAVVWNDNPRAFIATTTENRGGLTTAFFTKQVPAQTGFALDLVGGLKFYVSRHWGFRAEMQNVVSFQDFSPKFSTIDVSGLRGTAGAILPLTGTLHQSTRFNQTSGSGGIFMTF